MNRATRILVWIFTVIIIHLLTAHERPTYSSSLDSRLDLVIIIDDSGSMDSNDARGLRYTAAKMLVDIASDNDRIGIIQFATYAQSLTDELVLLDTQQKRSDLKQVISNSGANDIGENTSYVNALKEATELLNSPSNNQRAIIFLTDGLPNEGLEFIRPELDFFVNQDIPIYFMMLNAPDIQQDIVNAFQATGPQALNLGTSLDIGLAFVYALTELKPTSFLDILDSIPGDGDTIQFEVQSSNDQAISDVSFIFIPETRNANFTVTAMSSPANIESRSTPSDPNYSVFSYKGTSTQPIAGQWKFSADKGPIRGFAFIRSDAEFSLTYPIGQRLVRPSSDKLVVGTRLIGVGNVRSAAVNAQITLDQDCFTTLISSISNSLFELNPVGLSANGDLFWNSIDVPDEIGDFSLTLQLSQINKPLRLRRCFPISTVIGETNMVQIIKPNVTEPLQNGRIPFELQLSPNLTWEKATAFVQTPSDQILATELSGLSEKTEGVSASVNEPGIHIIRFLLQARDAQNNRLIFFRETNYEVIGNLCPMQPQYDLGEITTINSVLSEILVLNAPLVSQASDIEFTLNSIRHVQQNRQLEDDVEVQLCPAAQFGDGKVTCAIDIKPNVLAIPPGDIEIKVAINALAQNLCQNELSVRFRRPESRIDLLGYRPENPLQLGEITPQQPILSTELTYFPILWQGNPQLPENPEIAVFRNTETEQTIPFDQVKDIQIRLIGSPSDLKYELVFTPQNSLPPGKYLLTIRARAIAQNLNTNPEEIQITFSKPMPVVDIELKGDTIERDGKIIYRLKEKVWGIPWLPQIPLIKSLFNTRLYLPATSTTYYFPGELQLPALNGKQVRQGNDEEPVDTFAFSWRNDGPVQGQDNQFQHALVMELQTPLRRGTWEIFAEMGNPIREPTNVAFQIEVLGWSAFFWRRFLWLILGIILFRRTLFTVSPKFQGTLLVESIPLQLRGRGRADLQLALAENDNWTLLPDDPNSEVVIRCTSQPGEIEIEFKGDEPLRMKRGESFGKIAYI